MTDEIPKVVDHSNLFKFIDQIISDLRKSIRVINPKINDEYLNIAQTPNASLGAVFADAIHDYQKNRNNPTEKLRSARKVLYWFDEITTRGFISEGTDNIPKLHKCQSELTVKDNELRELGPKYETVKQERDELEKQLNVVKLENATLKMQLEVK